MSEPKTKTVRAVCPHDCPDTCGMLVTVSEGRATSLRGDPDHPFTKGFLCQKSLAIWTEFITRIVCNGR